MTQVDFYVLKGQSADERLKLASRIAEKAMLGKQQVYIHIDDPQEAEKLDETLWTFSQGSFVPHRILTDADTSDMIEPVLIGCNLEPSGERWEVMINLGSEVPEFFSRYERVIEVVDSDDQRRQKGRERYRYYRDRGYKLNSHNV